MASTGTESAASAFGAARRRREWDAPTARQGGTSAERAGHKPFCRWTPAGAGDGGEEETNEATASEGTNMKYQKPKVVAKSAPKQSFAAGCPTYRPVSSCCNGNPCMIGNIQ
jgi:hypothetical protein